jgi:hypothetical protein
LSAKLLPETKPEIEGKVDRQRLLTIQGKSRKNQIELARHYGITDYAAPAGGCLLTDPMFTKRLRDLFAHHRNFLTRDIELLKHGRHFRIDDASKIIVGRNSFENEALQRLSAGEDILIQMAQFPGPTVLVPSQSDDTTVRYAASLCALYSDAPKDEEVVVVCRIGDNSQTIRIKAAQREDAERRMI